LSWDRLPHLLDFYWTLLVVNIWVWVSPGWTYISYWVYYIWDPTNPRLPSKYCGTLWTLLKLNKYLKYKQTVYFLMSIFRHKMETYSNKK
jgi:hypothetical protein